MRGRGAWVALVAFVGVLLTACATSEREAPSATDDEIIGGVDRAAEFPEVVRIDSDSSGICTGTLVAPRIVLTAGHCVVGSTRWFVYTSSMTRSHAQPAFVGDVLDYTRECESNSSGRTCHDVGLVYLAKPIELEKYASIEFEPAADGTMTVSVGRTLDQVDQYRGFFATRERAIMAAAKEPRLMYPWMYFTERSSVQGGDSGGPTFVVGQEHRIVGVVAAVTRQTGHDLIARLDGDIGTWLQQKLAVEPPPPPAEPTDRGRWCHENTDCQSGFCVTDWHPNSYCSIPCGAENACPDQWSCQGSPSHPRKKYDFHGQDLCFSEK